MTLVMVRLDDGTEFRTDMVPEAFTAWTELLGRARQAGSLVRLDAADDQGHPIAAVFRADDVKVAWQVLAPFDGGGSVEPAGGTSADMGEEMISPVEIMEGSV